MSPLLFWLFVAIMLFFGGMVVLNRNPVASALSLVVCFLALASLYVSLDAYFIGVIQILVYAGAVMVLFLFIILFVKVLCDVSYSFEGGNAKFQAIQQGPQGDVWHVGMVLFQQYNIPLQVVGTLILVASIGVVILSKRELK